MTRHANGIVGLVGVALVAASFFMAVYGWPDLLWVMAAVLGVSLVGVYLW